MCSMTRVLIVACAPVFLGLAPLKLVDRLETSEAGCSLSLGMAAARPGSPFLATIRLSIRTQTVEVLNPFLEPQHPSVVRLACFKENGDYVGDFAKWVDGYDLQPRQTPALPPRGGMPKVTVGRRMRLRASVFTIDDGRQAQTPRDLEPGNYWVQAVAVKRLLKTWDAANVPGRGQEELCRSQAMAFEVIPGGRGDTSVLPGSPEGYGQLKIVDARFAGKCAYAIDYEYVNTTPSAIELVDPFANQFGSGGPLTPFQFAWKDESNSEVATHPLTIFDLPGRPRRHDSLFIPADGICGASIFARTPLKHGSYTLEMYATESILPHVGFPEEVAGESIKQSTRRILTASKNIEYGDK